MAKPTGFVGFDASRRPIVGCFDCGLIPLPVARDGMNHRAREILKEHNGQRHPGRRMSPGMMPRRDLGLCDWF
jgi:hypothetical protein